MGVERISVSILDVPELLGLRGEQVDRAVSDGSLVIVRVGDEVVVRAGDLRAYAAAQGLHVPDLTLDADQTG